MKLQVLIAKKILANIFKENKMLDKNYQLKRKNTLAYLRTISEEQKMKLWIKTLLSVQNSLPEIIKSVDKIIEINAIMC